MASEKNLGFSDALTEFIAGAQIARAAWQPGFHLELEDGVIYHVEPNGDRVNWSTTHEDLLAEDWMVTKEAEEDK